MADGTLVKPELTSGMIQVGGAFLGALDAAGMKLPAAFWWFDVERSDWVLVLVSPDLGREGPLTLYRRVQEVLDALPDTPDRRSLPLSRIAIVAPDEPAVAALAVLARTDWTLSGIRLTNNIVNGMIVSDAYLYRQTLEGRPSGPTSA